MSKSLHWPNDLTYRAIPQKTWYSMACLSTSNLMCQYTENTCPKHCYMGLSDWLPEIVTYLITPYVPHNKRRTLLRVKVSACLTTGDSSETSFHSVKLDEEIILKLRLWTEDNFTTVWYLPVYFEALFKSFLDLIVCIIWQAGIRMFNSLSVNKEETTLSFLRWVVTSAQIGQAQKRNLFPRWSQAAILVFQM